MSSNDQGPQNLAQAEAEALRALEAGAWRVWQAGSGPLPAAYGRWCATEIGLATAALRERAEKAEAALSKMTGESERFCADYQREYVRARKAEEALGRWDAQAIGEALGLPIGADVPDRAVGAIKSLRKRAEAAEAEVARLRGMMDRAVPYITQTGLGAAIYEAVKREARATPAERAAAGLAPEAHAQPQVLPEHLAYIEASASAWIDLSCASDQATKAADALRAAVARRDGGAE